jgi:two-component system chemotaxis response regulator CheY
MRVVIADDQARMRGLARTDVEHVGHTVVAEAANGRELLEAVSSESPDAVVMDWHMPGVDGTATIAELTRICPGVKVIVYSASLDPATWETVMTNDVSAFVEKGDLAELRAAFESCSQTS